MGTDIHAVFQRKTADGWEDVPSFFEQDRHYYLFSILAGVRNGYGFAGVKTYEPVEPISEPRGLPEDFEGDADEHRVSGADLLPPYMREYSESDLKEKGYLSVWLGDHSHSWLTADEILAYAQKHRKASQIHSGVISIEEYRKWDGKRPEAYCGGISGRDIKVAESAVDAFEPGVTHVRVSWIEDALEPISYFLEEIQRLKDLHGEVRMVFGFDS
jgi:hypothetical protein